ncbi:MAG: hypothetical protein FWG98_08720 [Candidatus Cloacimonetes bacterium]|nr:hypothetical protein [Candidatus Cloacimonadota bacterium]
MKNCGNCGRWTGIVHAGKAGSDGLGECGNINSPYSKGDERFPANHSCEHWVYYVGSYEIGSPSSNNPNSIVNVISRRDKSKMILSIIFFIISMIMIIVGVIISSQGMGFNYALLYYIPFPLLHFWICLFSDSKGWKIGCGILAFSSFFQVIILMYYEDEGQFFLALSLIFYILTWIFYKISNKKTIHKKNHKE